VEQIQIWLQELVVPVAQLRVLKIGDTIKRLNAGASLLAVLKRLSEHGGKILKELL
jgi:hypothetical protein